MKTALILDDQSAYCKALARSLRGELDVVGAETQERAKAMLRPDMAVAMVDICLNEAIPGNREGLEFIRWLRSGRPDMTIIAMSARDEADIPERARQAGADVFLSKPLRISELKRILAEFKESP